MNHKIIALIFFWLWIAPSYAQNLHAFATTTDSQRFQMLIKEIRCVVCQNQSIADSNAPLANDLRAKVHQMIVAHQSDAEIKNYLVKRYGEFILLKPRFNKLTAVLWFFPFAAVLCGLFFLVTRHCKYSYVCNDE